MSHEPPTSGAKFQSVPSKQYRVRESAPEAFMVELPQWQRIQRRVRECEQDRPPGWLGTVASTAISIGVGALVAVIVLPQSGGTHLGSGVEPALWAITVAGIVLGAVFVALALWMRKKHRHTTEDICAEMDTILAAWEQREGEGG